MLQCYFFCDNLYIPDFQKFLVSYIDIDFTVYCSLFNEHVETDLSCKGDLISTFPGYALHTEEKKSVQ